MIEKQPTSLTPPPQSDELISSVVGSVLKRQELIDINPDKIESSYGRPYAYKIRQLQQEENQRLQVAARERSRPKERRPISLKRRLAQGALALSLVAGVTPFVVNVFHHDDQGHDSGTELAPEERPGSDEIPYPLYDPQLAHKEGQPDLPPAEYLPPKDPASEYESPPGYENEEPSNNDESNDVVVPDVPPMNPQPNDYDNPPPEPGNW